MTEPTNDEDPGPVPEGDDDTIPVTPCVVGIEIVHYWPDDYHEGDTCNCGSWYRYLDRIESAS